MLVCAKDQPAKRPWHLHQKRSDVFTSMHIVAEKGKQKTVQLHWQRDSPNSVQHPSQATTGVCFSVLVSPSRPRRRKRVRLQLRKTKIIPILGNKIHWRPDELKLFTLEKRMLRNVDKIFKIIKGFNNVVHRIIFTLNENLTRNNGLKLHPRGSIHRNVETSWITESECLVHTPSQW